MIEPDEGLEEDSEYYEPKELVPAEVLDIGAQFMLDIRSVMKEYALKPIPGDKPVNFARAGALIDNALTANVMNYVLMRQIELDKAEETPWWVKHMWVIIICSLSICMILGMIGGLKYVFNN